MWVATMAGVGGDEDCAAPLLLTAFVTVSTSCRTKGCRQNSKGRVRIVIPPKEEDSSILFELASGF